MRVGCTFVLSLMAESKLIEFRVNPGKADVRELVCDKTWVQLGVQQSGRKLQTQNQMILSHQVSNTLEKEATVEAKQTRKMNKKQSSDNSVQSYRDYSRYDIGRNADDVDTDLPPEFLKEKNASVCNTYLKISEAEVKNIEY